MAVDVGGSSDKNIEEFVTKALAALICYYKMLQAYINTFISTFYELFILVKYFADINASSWGDFESLHLIRIPHESNKGFFCVDVL